MSDSVVITLIVAISIVVMFLFAISILRDRIKDIKVNIRQASLELTLYDKQNASSNLSEAEKTRTPDAPNLPQTNSESLEKAQNTIENLTTKLSKTVLWVDDHPAYNQYEKQALEPLGIKVIQVESNKEGYQTIEGSQIDLVITDIGRDSQETNGIDLLKTLAEQRPDLPVAVYTTDKMVRENKSMLMRLGAKMVTAFPSELITFVIEELK